jgi:phosphate:Na+ symporter
MQEPLDHFALWTGLFGGLALFLFGMDIMTSALKRAAGDYLKDLLGRLTRNRAMGVGVGAFVTAVVNSSSVTTVILVGFIGAGLLSMAQSVSVIMGANIGSTVTAQVLAFKVTNFALPMVTVGFLLSFVPSREDVQDYGRILLGIGLVFYGMAVMSDAMVPLRSYPPFLDLVRDLANPIAAAIVGALFTAVIQSSAATTGIVIVLAGQGLISLETAIAVALGANIGTCATAGLAVIGKPREATRAAVVHVLFNVAGVALWIGFIPELAAFVRWLSPTVGHLEGLARTAAEAPRQVANAHTIFNVGNTLLLIGFTPQIARLVEWLVPDRPLREEDPLAPKFLDEALLSTPAVALGNARLEIARLGGHVLSMVRRVLPTAVSGSRRDLSALSVMDKAADRLHRAILGYLSKVSSGSLSPEQAHQLMQLLEVANDLEHIGDRVATDVVTSARKRLDERTAVSEQGIAAITTLHGEVIRALEGALTAVRTEDEELAAKVRHMKREVAGITRAIERESVDHLTADPSHRLMGYVREVELLEILDGIFKIARRIARSQLPQRTAEEG